MSDAASYRITLTTCYFTNGNGRWGDDVSRQIVPRLLSEPTV